MTPLRKISLAEIRAVPDPYYRLNDMYSLLEYLLGVIRGGDVWKASELVRASPVLRPVQRTVLRALTVRNRLQHAAAGRAVTPQEVEQAFAVLDSAVVRLQPHVAPEIAVKVYGPGSAPSLPAAAHGSGSGPPVVWQRDLTEPTRRGRQPFVAPFLVVAAGFVIAGVWTLFKDVQSAPGQPDVCSELLGGDLPSRHPQIAEIASDPVRRAAVSSCLMDRLRSADGQTRARIAGTLYLVDPNWAGRAEATGRAATLPEAIASGETGAIEFARELGSAAQNCVPALAPLLRSRGNAATAAVAALSAIGPPAAAQSPGLTEEVKKGDPSCWAEVFAVWDRTEWTDTFALACWERLSAGGQDEQLAAETAALLRLGAKGAAVRSKAIEALRGPQEKRWCQSCLILGSIGQGGAAVESQLLAALSHPCSQWAAAWALSRIGELRSVSAADLLKHLSSDDHKVGLQLPALGLTPDQPIAALVASALENAPVELAGEVFRKLIDCVRIEEKRNSHTRYAAARSALHLVQSSKVIIEGPNDTALRAFLIEVQRDVENRGIRRTQALRFLQSSGGQARRSAQNTGDLDKALWDALEEQPSKGQPGEAAEIIHALAAFDPAGVRDKLRVQGHRDEVLRSALLSGGSLERMAALDAVDSSKAIGRFVTESLVHCLGDDDWQVRARAGVILRKLAPDWHVKWVRTQRSEHY